MKLADDMSDTCVPYLLACGRDKEAVEFYVSRCDNEAAAVVAEMSSERDDLIPNLDVGYSASSPATANAATSVAPTYENCAIYISTTQQRSKTESEVEASRALIKLVVNKTVTDLLKSGKSIQAATHLICFGEQIAAKNLLLSCGEYDLGFAVAHCFDLETLDATR